MRDNTIRKKMQKMVPKRGVRITRPFMIDRRKKVCIVTACGNQKHDYPLPARKLYKSARITAVYNRRCNCDMYILSAKHGLLPSEKVIAPYNRIMDQMRMQELLLDMIPVLQKYDKVIFFNGGARSLYAECIKEACNRADRPLDSFGSKILEGIGDLEAKINDACEL